MADEYKLSLHKIEGNKVPYIGLHMPHVDFFYFGIAVKLNRANELVVESAHALEHLLIEGSKQYPSREAVYDSISGLGGHLWALTSNFHTYYFCKVPVEHKEQAIDTVVDVVLKPKLEEIDRVKKAIHVELTSRTNDTSYQGKLLLNNVMFEKNSINYLETIDKRLESLEQLTKEELVEIYEQNYNLKNMIITIGGNYQQSDEELVTKAISKKYTPKKIEAKLRTNLKETIGKVEIQNEKGSDYFTLGFHMPPVTFNEEATNIAWTLLGGYPNSKIPMKLREEMGLSYGAYTAFAFQPKGAKLFVTCDCKPGTLDEAKQAALSCITDLATKGISEKELQQVKNFKIGRIKTAEGSHNKIQNALNEFIRIGTVISDNELIKKYDAVTIQEVDTVLRFFQEQVEKENYAQVLFRVKPSEHS